MLETKCNLQDDERKRWTMISRYPNDCEAKVQIRFEKSGAPLNVRYKLEQYYRIDRIGICSAIFLKTTVKQL